MRCRELVIAALMISATAAADPTEDRLIKLADYHYRAGHWYRAVGAYEELALFATDDAVRVPAAVRIAMSYAHGHQLTDAVTAYDAALRLTHDPALDHALRIQRALARAERTFDEPGAEALDAIAAELAPLTIDGAPRRALALYQLARIDALGNDLPRARAAAAQLETACAAAPAPPCGLRATLAGVLARPAPPRRSPWLGVAMSAVIPGSGSVYGGHFVDGIYYFGLTALSGLGAWDVYDDAHGWRGQRAAFYGLAALGAIFYTSGLLSAYVDVARHNEVDALAARRARWDETDTRLPLEDLAP